MDYDLIRRCTPPFPKEEGADRSEADEVVIHSFHESRTPIMASLRGFSRMFPYSLIFSTISLISRLSSSAGVRTAATAMPAAPWARLPGISAAAPRP